MCHVPISLSRHSLLRSILATYDGNLSPFPQLSSDLKVPTILLQGRARMFPAAVKEWASPAIHSSYFSVTFALNGLFQTTSGAWMYFVQPPGMIKGFIFDVRSSCLTASIMWHLNESHTKIRRVNENFPRTLLTQSRVSSSFIHPLEDDATTHLALNSTLSTLISL